MDSSFFSLLEKINCPSADNGEYFTDPMRRNAILDLLCDSNYKLIKHSGLSLIYQARDYSLMPTVLISCHIDSLYSHHHFQSLSDLELLGTFDNSILNTLLVDLMLKNSLPANVMIAFTGNEEEDSLGADETIDFLMEKHEPIWQRLEMVIVLDITSEGYDSHAFTLENYFIEKQPLPDNCLHFNAKSDLKQYLRELLHNYSNLFFINSDEAGADESWDYHEYDLNCFSLCLPSRPHPAMEKKDVDEWMHSDHGIIVKKESVDEYAQALVTLTNELYLDFLVRQSI